MPVITTMTTIAILRARAGPRLPFFDAGLMRELLDEALADYSEETLKATQPITDKLEQALEDYRSSVNASLDKYIEESTQRYLPTDELIERFEPLDRERTAVLRNIVKLREALLETLDEQQWYDAFK